MISFDTETYLFEPGNMAPKVVCLTWANEDEDGIVVGGDVAGVMFKTLLSSGPLVGHNVAFDAAVLMATCPDLIEPIFGAYHAGRVHCTMVREKLLDIARGNHFIQKGRYSLAKIAERYKIIPEGSLDEAKEGENAWRMRYSELDGVPFDEWPQEAVDYAIDDSILTLAIYAAQELRAQRIGYDLPDQEAQVRAHLILHLAGVWGVHTDPDRVEPLRAITRERMEKLADELIEHGLAGWGKKKGQVVLKKKTKELRARVRHYFMSQGLPVPVTNSGLPAADKEVLEDVDLPEVEVWQEYQSLEKSGSTYVEKLTHGYDCPIHANYNILVDTGRCSCSKPNWQNQPRMPGVRECVIPRDGHVFVACDYDSQEMRTWAEACVRIVGWSKLADAYNDNPDFDPHTALAVAQLVTDEAVSYEEGLKRKKLVHPCPVCGCAYDAPKDCDECHGEGKPDIVKTMRQRAKIPNFGLPGGMGVRGLRKFARGYGARLSVDEAKELIAGWKAQWPENLPYFEHVKALVGSSNNGRMIQLVSGRVRGRVSYTRCANSYFQGFAADCSKAALWEVGRRCYAVLSSALYGCRIVFFIHDEIVIEAPEHRAHEAAMEMRDIMVKEAEKYTIHVPSRASASMMQRWYKNAEPVYIDDRLVPWEPKQ